MTMLTMLDNPWTQARPWMACLFMTCLATLASAQVGAPEKNPLAAYSAKKTQERKAPPHYVFDGTDFVRARIDGSMRTRYFVGEPVVIPLILSNHTHYPITVTTNYCPRSSLEVLVYQENMPSRVYHGPYAPGIYPPSDIFLYPLDEYKTNFVMWSDIDEPTGLFFSQPGQYTIEISQTIGVTEGGFNGKLPLGNVTIDVEPTPPAFRGFVDDLQTPLQDEKLASRSPAYYLQLSIMPPGWEKKLPQYINSLPTSALTPCLCFAYADSLQKAWGSAKTPAQAQDLATEALKYYQIAAKSDFAKKLDAYDELLKFTDKLGMSSMTATIAQEFIDALPKSFLGKVGDSQLLKKYLGNTDEIDPTKDWVLLP